MENKKFFLYARKSTDVENIANFLAKSSVTTRTGKRISKTKASFILSNPFYIGLFKYGGEIHEGKHEPIISKKLLDEAQEMLKFRGQPDRKPQNEPQPFCGLISCASSRSFFAQRLGGGIESSCFARLQKLRPVFDC